MGSRCSTTSLIPELLKKTFFPNGKLVEDSREECIAVCRVHLAEFLEKYPDARYEDWLMDLHPENANSAPDGTPSVDIRFYHEDSDHRRTWNTNPQVTFERRVLGRYRSPRERKKKPLKSISSSGSNAIVAKRKAFAPFNSI